MTQIFFLIQKFEAIGIVSWFEKNDIENKFKLVLYILLFYIYLISWHTLYRIVFLPMYFASFPFKSNQPDTINPGSDSLQYDQHINIFWVFFFPFQFYFFSLLSFLSQTSRIQFIEYQCISLEIDNIYKFCIKCAAVLVHRHRALKFNSHIRFCNRLLTKQGISLGHEESKKCCLIFCRNRSAPILEYFGKYNGLRM